MSFTVSFPPFSLTSLTATLAPSPAKSIAVALPMPDPAPVTSATFPANLFNVPRDHGSLTVISFSLSVSARTPARPLADANRFPSYKTNFHVRERERVWRRPSPRHDKGE